MATVSYVHSQWSNQLKRIHTGLSTHLNVEMATRSRGEISCTVQKTESVKKKTSDKSLRRFNLAEIIFKDKKKMKNIAHKK